MRHFPPGAVIGIFGGGQLGRMTALAAAQMGYDVHVFCPKEDSPAFYVSRYHTLANYDDEQALLRFAQSVDLITFEFENVPYRTVQLVAEHAPVHPSWDLLYLSQNRLREKQFVNKLGIGTTMFAEVYNREQLDEALQTIGPCALLKSAEMGYDGKGQQKIDQDSEISSLVFEGQAILEQYVPFACEVSSIVARTADGTVAVYPTVQNIHENGILRKTIAPATLDSKILREAEETTIAIAEAVELVGLLAVEYFVTYEEKLLFNEMAPRPHNSGHWTLDGCATSQFEQFVRAVCGLPLGATHLHTPVLMENLLGAEVDQWQELLSDPDVKLHLYGKASAAPGRKMGHVNRLVKQEALTTA
ncbi:MAG: 5-(carboxyamino)imidazole ribonucleotide synthase [Chlamydiales bacterium]|nr:5-(carboxyamino)imidazole ribonucleotide synthase [Chlamydiia bacterium]MCP5507622.1 5-(carboxyamino)imidazole ribonucleotide synthase [Chlamydiales bacterium]